MFRWLRQRRRNIFTYHDGTRWRACDPLVAWRSVWEDPECNPDRDIELATGITQSGVKTNYNAAAQDRVLAMIRRTFGLKAWSEQSAGLTIDETLGVLWQFFSYMDRLKKKPEASPMPSEPLDQRSSLPENSTTPSGSDSSSTPNESKSDESLSSSKRSVRL